MDKDQKDCSSSEEDNVQEEDGEPEGVNMDANSPKVKTKTILISTENLKRRPLHAQKEDSQKKTDRRNFNTNKTDTLKLSASTSCPNSFSFYIGLSCCILCIIVGVYFLYIHNAKFTPEKHLDVKRLMQDLKSKFEDQPFLTYRVIESALNRAFSKNSNSPGIIVLISSKEAKETSQALASTLVQLVSEPLNSVLVEANTPFAVDRLKKEIDVIIRSNLTEKQMRAILVRNLDQIPFEAAMMFHSFCDHENAPFKRVLYVMTASVEEKISPNSDSKQWDVLATKRLKAAWGDSGEDQVASLISRLTVSVAAVLPK